MVFICQKILRVIVIINLLAACTSTPPTHFYILTTQSSPAAAVADGGKKSSIGVGPISIPTLLERKQIIIRTDQNTVQIAEFHQWAAPLKDNIAEVLTQNLTALQPRRVIRAYPWSTYGSVNYRVLIDIDRFDSQPGRSVILEARWTIIDEKTHVIVTNDKSRFEHPLTETSYPATVKALSGVLYELSQELSQAFEQLK